MLLITAVTSRSRSRGVDGSKAVQTVAGQRQRRSGAWCQEQAARGRGTQRRDGAACRARRSGRRMSDGEHEAHLSPAQDDDLITCDVISRKGI